MSTEPLDRIPNELFRVIIKRLDHQPTDIIKLGLTAPKLSQRLVDTFWSHLTDVENPADGGCRFFNARQRLQVFVKDSDTNAKEAVKRIVQMSNNLSSITTRNSFDRELTNHLLNCLGYGEQQLNHIALSSCVSDTKQASSLLRRSQPYLDTVQLDGAWAKVPAAVSGIGSDQTLDHLILSFAGQQLCERELHKLFCHLSAMKNTRIQKLSLDIARSDMNGSSKFVKRAWSQFGDALQARQVESLTLSGTTFDLLRIQGTTKRVFHKITSIRLVSNSWSLNHSLQDWLEVFPQLNHLFFKLHANCGSQYFSTINSDRSCDYGFDSPSIVSTRSHSIIRSCIPINGDVIVEGQFDRLTDTAFEISISPE